MKKKCIVLFLMVTALTGPALFAQAEESFADKLSFSLEFGTSILSIDSEGAVDSLTDAGFNEDETKIGIGYEDELWGASAALKFGNENLKFLSGEVGEMFGSFPLALDELYGWVKPFGEHFKFTGGLFDNTDGLADYTDDIDDFGMGAFLPGEDGEPFSEPEAEFTGPSLVNGLLTDVIFGPVTLQLLLAPNYSKESASVLSSGLLSTMAQAPVAVDAEARFFRMGGRIVADLGAGTVSGLFKTFQWPAAVENGVWQVTTGSSTNIYSGAKDNYNTFGLYFDLTAVENLGLSLGYTGFLPVNDGTDVENVLYSGIDLRATWTGIPGLSISAHNNLSLANGAEKEWRGMLPGKDSSFLFLYNAIGGTKELTEKFSINAEISNVLSKTDLGDAGKIDFDNFGVGAKFIVTVSEQAEFNAGLKVDFAKTTLSGSFGDAEDTLTAFSVPIGIVLSF